MGVTYNDMDAANLNVYYGDEKLMDDAVNQAENGTAPFDVEALLTRYREGCKAQEIRIAVFVQGNQEGELGAQLAQRLTDRNPREGMFSFYLSRDEQQLRDDVVSRRAECGYVIGEGLKDRLDRGDYKRCITVYSAPSTVTAKLSTEVVFSVMMELYDKWRESGATFHFEYAALDPQRNVEVSSSSAAPNVFPVRGLVAICLFIVGLYGTVTTGTDVRNGLFLPLPYRLRGPCRVACIAGPVCMAAASGLLAIWMGGSGQGMGKELAAMGGYILLIVAFSSLLGAIFKNPQALCCLIPFFMIGSLIFCPVILDAGKFFPVLREVGRLFLPYYYLRLF